MHSKGRTMRKRASLLVLLVAVAGVLAAAVPAGVGAQAPAQDSAVGTDVLFPFVITATFEARSGPQGESPSGSVRVNARLNFAGGPVTCLTVTGNRATIGFEERDFPFDSANGGFLFVEDNGTPGAGRDNIQFTLATDAPTVCPANTVVYQPNSRIEFGDIVVVDAQPFPTSKEQCKNGGWRDFGETFKNQGQCVAFVQRGPKP
jgi:hypothetical protein